MFNVVVCGGGTSWETDQLMRFRGDRLHDGRSGSEGASISLKKPETLKALEGIRTLLMYENIREFPNVVRLGHVFDVRVVGTDMVFRFVEEGRLTREKVMEFGSRIQMGDFDFYRTHWAVKDGDIPSGLVGVSVSSFDVFLSHNSNDKDAVRELKDCLVERGLRPWFDEDELRPGIPWQKQLEEGIEGSKSCAVLIGKDGLGPWEDEEMQAALQLAVKDKRPIIPVLMPGAARQPKLPMFLGNRMWVDLREGLEEELLDKLEWGITGKKPK